ncbi:MAG: S41 family peptidase, partial [Bacteroidales bacterium]
MKRSSVKRVAVTILVTLSLSATLTLYGQQDRREKASLKIVQLLNILDDNYIDTLNFTEISEETTRYILSLLDPHSTYIGAEDVKRSNEPLEGSFEGIGIEFAIIRDTLTVISTIVGGPSEKVGLRAGDQIVAVDGEPIASVKLTNSDVYKYLRGAGGTRVILKVVRRGSEELLTFTIVRGKIPINSVDASYMLEEGVAYVKLSRFASNSAREIIEAIMALGDHSKLKGMVLDLRSNSGGYLGSAIEIANFFLERGETIVSIEGRKIKRVSEVAKGNGFFRKGALAIVVDQYSASASEIVAGAIQDWDRGAIFGRATFGKGLVQQPFNL